MTITIKPPIGGGVGGVAPSAVDDITGYLRKIDASYTEMKSKNDAVLLQAASSGQAATAASIAAAEAKDAAATATQAASGAASATASAAGAIGLAQYAADAAPYAPSGALLDSNRWLPANWSSSANGSPKAEDMAPHTKDVTTGSVRLGVGESIWSRRTVQRLRGKGAFDVTVLVTISGLADGATATLDINDRAFAEFGATTTLTTKTVTGLKNGVNTCTVRFSNADLGRLRYHRLAAKSTSSNAALTGMTFEVGALFAYNVTEPEVYSIFDLGFNVKEGDDVAAILNAAFKNLPAGTSYKPVLINLEGLIWPISDEVCPAKEYQGPIEGRFKAIGTAASWTTADSYDDEVYRFVHDEDKSGWTDKATRQKGMIRPLVSRTVCRDVILDGQFIASGFDGRKGGGHTVTRLTVFFFGVFGILSKGGSWIDPKCNKFALGDPRIGLNKVNTGFGLVLASSDTDWFNPQLFGGGACVLQLPGYGTNQMRFGHSWNSSGGLSVNITGPRVKGEVIKITRYKVDDPTHMIYDSSILDAAVDADNFPTVTFKVDWNTANDPLLSLDIDCAPIDRECARMYGWNSDWSGHYHDDGYYWFFDLNHRVIGGRGLINPTRIQLTWGAMFLYLPTYANQVPSGIILNCDDMNTRYRARGVPNPKKPTASWAIPDAAWLQSCNFEEFGHRHATVGPGVQTLFTGHASLIYTEFFVNSSLPSVYWGGQGGEAAVWSGTPAASGSSAAAVTAADLLAKFGKATGAEFYKTSGDAVVNNLKGVVGAGSATRWTERNVAGDKLVDAGAAAEGGFYIRTGGADRLTITPAGIASLKNVPQYVDNSAAAAGGLIKDSIYRDGNNFLRIVQ